MPASASVPCPDSALPPRVVVVIPSRWASSRLPGKPLASIGGMTMVERVYRRAAAARGVCSVLVATDDARIAAAVAGFGGAFVMTRPDHASGTDRIAEAARDLSCDLVVNVQGDEPGLDPAAIEAAVAPLSADASLMMSTLGAPLDPDIDLQNPNTVKVLRDRQGYALYFSRAPVPYRREAGEALTPVLRHIGLYVYRREFLLTLASLPRTPLERIESLEQLRALEHGYRIKVVETSCAALSVDTAEDLERVRRLAADGLLA